MMSDGYDFHEATASNDDVGVDGPAAVFASARPRDRRAGGATLMLGDLADWLPRLGTVLWLERRDAATTVSLRVSVGSRLLLLEDAAAAMLARCTTLRAHSAVMAQGPREWLCFHTGSGEINAKLFLLPDSDYLAWDQMSAACGLVSAEPVAHAAPTHATFLRRALARFGHCWQARLLEFDRKPRPWLYTLGAHPPLRISLLGLDIARTIVHDENAEWISPLHMG